MGATQSATENSLLIETQAAGPAETPVYRNADYGDHLVNRPFKADPATVSLLSVFLRTALLHPKNRMLLQLGHPELAHVTTKEERKAKKRTHEWLTYEQVSRMVRNMVALGADEANVAIYSRNSPEWVVALLGIWAQGKTCVPLYDSLGPAAMRYIIEHANIRTVFCSPEHVGALNEQCPGRTLIVMDDAFLKGLDPAGAEPYGDAGWPRCDPDRDLAYIMYTSGTTGDPKGVMLTHRNVGASLGGLLSCDVNLTEKDSYMSYLPLAHSFETCMLAAIISAGGHIGFYDGDVRHLSDNARELRPTLFAGVPRVYTRIQSEVLQKVAKGSWMARTLVHGAESYQAAGPKGRTRLWDTVVFNKVKNVLGGRIRLMVSGAAPLPDHTMAFMRVYFGCDVIQGYGMTENMGCAFATPFAHARVGTVGRPAPCTEFKLRDAVELNYTSVDRPFPRGEICLRGPNVFAGYYKNEAKTAEDLDADGWLATGDIGAILEDGSVKIIDRKKNIFKLAQGEYVAAEELESVFSESTKIDQVFIDGNSEHTFVVAIVVSEHPKKEIMADIAALKAKHKIPGFKVPRDIHVETERNEFGQGFNMENGCLTPTFKLKRPQLRARYKAQIDSMYQIADV